MGAFGFGPELAIGRRGPAGAAGPGFDFAGGALPAGATLSRASAASFVDAGGVLSSAAANVARFDRDPVTLALRGLLVEGAATNVGRRSQAFGASVWPADGCTVASDTAASIDGTSGADTVTTTGGGREIYTDQSGGINGDHGLADGVATFAVYARAGSNGWLQLGQGSPSSGARAWFDLTNGAIGTSGGGASAGMATAGGGFYRCWITFTAVAGGYLAIRPSHADGLVGASAANGSIVLAQSDITQTGAPGSAIVTAAGAASRAADALVLDWGSRGVADGAITVRHTFDDGSMQDVAATVAGGTAPVPTNLNRRWLRRADKL